MAGLFVTGTDTDVGKTWVSCGLMVALQRLGIEVVGMKPVASGCEHKEQGLRNDDAMNLMKYAGKDFGYRDVNPFAFLPAIAPHIAASDVGVTICCKTIVQCYRKLDSGAGLVVVEGAGGWKVPLNERETIADLVCMLRLPVVLVVGVRLGCINHALLSYEAMVRDGVEVAGWVANCIDRDCLRLNENIETIRQRIDSPLLATLAWQEQFDAAAVADSFDMSLLRKICKDINNSILSNRHCN